MPRTRAEGKSVGYFSNKLRIYRNILGLSQVDVAQRLNMTVNTYAALEAFPPGEKGDRDFQALVLKPRGQRAPYAPDEGNAAFQALRDKLYVDELASAFGVDVDTFLSRIGLPDLTQDVPNVADIQDGEGHRPDDAPQGIYVPWGEQHTIFGGASLPLRIRQENDIAETRALGVLRLPAGLQSGEGSFAYTWTEEFEQGRDALYMGEIIFIAVAAHERQLEDSALYVLTDRGDLMIRRAVKDEDGKWWLVSDHWNRHTHRSLRVTAKDSRIHGRVHRFRDMMRGYLKHSGQEGEASGPERQARKR